MNTSRWLFVTLFCIGLGVNAHASDRLPKELRDGLLEFHLERGNFSKILVLIEDDEYSQYPIHVVSAQQALGLPWQYDAAYLEKFLSKSENKLRDRLRLAQLFYREGQCREALKHLKGKHKKLSAQKKTLRAYIRGQCFIELGNQNFAAQSLSDAVGGDVASAAYYNLGADYSATSRNPKRALVSLRVARDINNLDTFTAKELTNLINLSAGALYLKHEKPLLATEFFNQIALDSVYVTQALYLSGLAKNEAQDYRGAIQSWRSNYQYGLAEPGVAESVIALPVAQALSGYQSQALESYVKASEQLQTERDNIKKLRKGLQKHGALSVLVLEESHKDLQWFLARSTHNNTTRAAYMRFLSKDPDIYNQLEQITLFQRFEKELARQQTQLASLAETLKTQAKQIKGGNSTKSINALESRLKRLKQLLDDLESGVSGVNLSKPRETVAELEARVHGIKPKINKRATLLSPQQQQIKKARKDLAVVKKKLQAFLKKQDELLIKLCDAKLEELQVKLTKYYEQTELGLIQILESRARLRTKRTNLLDGRYQ